MTWYIILSVLLLLAVFCVAWLALRLRKTKKAQEKALQEASDAICKLKTEAKKAAEERLIRSVDIKYVPQRFEQMVLQAAVRIPLGFPKHVAEEELKSKIAELIPEFWEISRDMPGPLQQEIRYVARLYVYKKEMRETTNENTQPETADRVC